MRRGSGAGGAAPTQRSHIAAAAKVLALGMRAFRRLAEDPAARGTLTSDPDHAAEGRPAAADARILRAWQRQTGSSGVGRELAPATLGRFGRPVPMPSAVAPSGHGEAPPPSAAPPHVDIAGGRPNAMGLFPRSAAVEAAMACDPALLDAAGRPRGEVSGRACSPRAQMAALHVERPLLISFIGAPRREQLERVATIRGLRGCARCGLFDVHDSGPFSSGLVMAWVYSLSIFCVQPHGDSPTRKAFFDAVQFGCIPVVLDGADRDTRGRAPFLPFGWALPWRNMTAQLSRKAWHYRMVSALKQAYPPARIRAMQRALAEGAHLTQFSMPSSPPGLPPRTGPKPRSARNASTGWVNADGRHCAEDAFDMLSVMLAKPWRG